MRVQSGFGQALVPLPIWHLRKKIYRGNSTTSPTQESSTIVSVNVLFEAGPVLCELTVSRAEPVPAEGPIGKNGSDLP